MLVLSRKLKEQIKIGDDITITVVKLRNNQIRLGIEAPRDVRVMRAELDKETPETTPKNDASANAETVAKPQVNACPVRYGLLFERFTDPDRSEYPDIDVDICQDGRADVINYVREKYGYVAQIITFGRLKAKQAIKDVARVNGLTPGEGQRLANLVPNELNITLDAALEKDPDFRAEYENDAQVRSVVDTARALEHHARHAGVHAAGVVVATQPLENIVPLCRRPAATTSSRSGTVRRASAWAS